MLMTAALPCRILSSSGLCAGQVNIHDPHSMHDVIISCSALSHNCCPDTAARRYGSSPMGHAPTHFAHLIHGCGALRLASEPLSTVTQLVPLHIGTSVEVRALPIIGPPASTFTSPSGSPPQTSIRSAIGVPIRTRKLAGFSISFPVTVV